MVIDYKIVWTEKNEMYFKEFSYETDGKDLPSSFVPNDLYAFYRELQDKKFPVIVFANEKSDIFGIYRYCNAIPIYG